MYFSHNTTIKTLLIVAVFMCVFAQAQQISLVPITETAKETWVNNFYQRKNGEYVGKGGKPFGRYTYYSFDTKFNPTRLDAWQKSAQFWPDLTLELGEVCYEFGIRYDGDDRSLKFGAMPFGKFGEIKYYHTESFPHDRMYKELYANVASPDNEKLVLVWQHPDNETKFTLTEFDSAFNKLAKYEFSIDLATNDKEYILFGDCKLDSYGNLFMVLRIGKQKKRWLLTYSLQSKKAVVEEMIFPEGYVYNDKIYLDDKQGRIYYTAKVKDPENSGGFLGIGEGDYTIDPANPVGYLYMHSVKNGDTREVAIKLSEDEIADVKKKYDALLMEKELANAFFIRYINVNVFNNGNCAVVFEMGYMGMVDYTNRESSAGNNSAFVRVYNHTTNKMMASYYFQMARRDDHPAVCMMLDDRLNVMTRKYIPLADKKYIYKQVCYQIDSTGLLQTFLYNGNKYYEVLDRAQIHTGGIPVSVDRDLFLLKFD